VISGIQVVPTDLSELIDPSSQGSIPQNHNFQPMPLFMRDIYWVILF